MQVFQRLQKLYMTMSYQVKSRLLNTVGTGYDDEVIQWCKAVTATIRTEVAILMSSADIKSLCHSSIIYVACIISSQKDHMVSINPGPIPALACRVSSAELDPSSSSSDSDSESDASSIESPPFSPLTSSDESDPSPSESDLDLSSTEEEEGK